MKKISILMFALLFLLTSAVMAEDEPAIDVADEAPSHLTVGNTTPMHGKFFTDLWEDVTTDGDVRDLVHGYNLIMWNGESGVYTHDPSVVNAIGIMDNEEGDRSYLIALQDDLFYSMNWAAVRQSRTTSSATVNISTEKSLTWPVCRCWEMTRS